MPFFVEKRNDSLLCVKGGSDKQCRNDALSATMMKEKLIVKRIVNNNIVIAENYSGQEFVAIGKGLGFRRRPYETIMQYEIAKMYVLMNKSSYLFRTLEEIPFEIIELTQKIIDVAQADLQNTYNVNLVVALADHINFSVNQFKAGLMTPVLVNEEVRRFYKEEYTVGKKAIAMINRTLNVELANEEAASIAFHLITATENRKRHDSLKIMRGVARIIEIVEDGLGMNINEESPAYVRFIIHLKFFMKSILFDKQRLADSLPKVLYEELKRENQAANDCVNMIATYVYENYTYKIRDDERLYLLVHIIRVKEYKECDEAKGENNGKD